MKIGFVHSLNIFSNIHFQNNNDDEYSACVQIEKTIINEKISNCRRDNENRKKIRKVTYSISFDSFIFTISCRSFHRTLFSMTRFLKPIISQSKLFHMIKEYIFDDNDYVRSTIFDQEILFNKVF